MILTSPVSNTSAKVDESVSIAGELFDPTLRQDPWPACRMELGERSGDNTPEIPSPRQSKYVQHFNFLSVFASRTSR